MDFNDIMSIIIGVMSGLIMSLVFAGAIPFVLWKTLDIITIPIIIFIIFYIPFAIYFIKFAVDTMLYGY